MANEGTVSITLQYEDDDEIPESAQVLLKSFNVSSKKITKAKVSVGTSEEAIPLGEATAPGYAMFVNLDATNYVELKTGTSGTVFGKLLPGEAACLRLGSGAQAPYWVANTAACNCLVFIINT